jgi:hypothetical protein
MKLPMSQDQSTEIVEQLFIALSNLQWTRQNCQYFQAALCQVDSPHTCWLQRLHHCAVHDADQLTELGRASIADLLNRGFQLLDQWPHRDRGTTQQWLGCRLFLAEANAFSGVVSGSINAIVSSQLGRDKLRLTYWPTLLDWALRKTSLDNASVLAVAGTTLFESTIQFARVAGIPVTQLVLSDESLSPRSMNLSSWLVECLSRCLESLDLQNRAEIRRIFMSPELEHGSDDSSAMQFSKFPVRDRVAIALADRVLVVSVKVGGKIAGLLERRLGTAEFPAASVFLAIAQYASMPLQDFSAVSAWLDRGAVGYVVMIDDARRLSRCCRCRQPSRVATLQICCSKKLWLERDLESWHFLAHCTRGNGGPVPQESTEGYYRRIWNEGRILPADPFLALLQILIDGRVRGSNWLTRGHQPSVSLSQVALPELLSRRRFRSHLGRWDWEPYGLLFNQSVLSQARPVIYGGQAEYEKLSSDEQVFFQPAETSVDWSVEQEWRVVGDIDLGLLPTEGVTVFTRFRAEAQQLAGHSQFPVVWVAD